MNVIQKRLPYRPQGTHCEICGAKFVEKITKIEYKDNQKIEYIDVHCPTKKVKIIKGPLCNKEEIHYCPGRKIEYNSTYY